MRLLAYAIILAILFIGALIVGFIAPLDFKHKLINMIRGYLKHVIPMRYSILELFLAILINNLRALAISYVIPVVGAILISVVNGFAMGIVLSLPITELNPLIRGICPRPTPEAEILVKLSLIIPHGVIEIPAVIIGCAASIYLWINVFRRIRNPNIDLKSIGLRVLKILIITCALLVLAAIIEVVITPFVAMLVGALVCR